MEIKIEADNNDITCCSHCDKPTTGMIAVIDEHMMSKYFLDVYCVIDCYKTVALMESVHIKDAFWGTELTRYQEPQTREPQTD